jgi:hypothetical protein
MLAEEDSGLKLRLNDKGKEVLCWAVHTLSTIAIEGTNYVFGKRDV